MTKAVKNAQYKVWAGLGWDDTPVSVTLPCATIAEANTAAKQLSQTANAEIRWNWEGEGKGHLVSATHTLKPQPECLTRYDYTLDIPEAADETRLLDAIFGKRKVDAKLDKAYAAGENALTDKGWDWDAIDYTVQVCNPTDKATLLDDLAELALEDEYKRGKADAKAEAAAKPASHRVTLTIPSISAGLSISPTLRAKNLKYARTDISIAFGGFTSYDAEGGWVDDAGELVTEKVTVIETFTDKPVGFITTTLTTLAERIAISLKQDCVLWTLDNAPNFVSQPDH